MSRNFLSVLWLCLAVGCFDHSVEHAENLGRAAPHAIALEICFQKAVETKQATGDDDKVLREYTVCADDADRKYK